MSRCSIIGICALVGTIGLLGAGCEEQQPTPPPAATVTAKAAPTATATATVAAKEPNSELDAEDIPVPEDYEEEVSKQITKDNLDVEVDKIEKELAQDKG